MYYLAMPRLGGLVIVLYRKMLQINDFVIRIYSHIYHIVKIAFFAKDNSPIHLKTDPIRK